MKTLENLQEGDYIAFGFNYNEGEPKEIMVSNVTSISRGQFLTHFLYGHHSLAEYINPEDVIAIGDNSASGKIKGWGGRYNILQPDHKLLK